jgi:hypothetical protein
MSFGQKMLLAARTAKTTAINASTKEHGELTQPICQSAYDCDQYDNAGRERQSDETDK